MDRNNEPRRRGRKPHSANEMVRAAGELFYRRGYQAVSVNELAAGAQATKMTLYTYFPSKAAIAAAWMEAVADAEARKHAAIATRCSGRPVDELRALVADAAAQIAATGFRGWPATNIVVELTNGDEPVRQLAAESRVSFRDRLHDLARAAGAANPATLADSVLLLLEGAAASRHVFTEAGPSARLEWAVEALLDAQGVSGAQAAPMVEADAVYL